MNQLRNVEFGHWMAPLRRLVRHFQTPAFAEPSVGVVEPAQRQSVNPIRPAGRNPRAAAPRSASAHAAWRSTRSPLRVIRVVEAGQASTLAGRILMTGRMADVCAELDRMVEREASLRPGA